MSRLGCRARSVGLVHCKGCHLELVDIRAQPLPSLIGEAGKELTFPSSKKTTDINAQNPSSWASTGVRSKVLLGLSGMRGFSATCPKALWTHLPPLYGTKGIGQLSRIGIYPLRQVEEVLIHTKIKKGKKRVQTNPKAAWSPVQALSLHRMQVPSTNHKYENHQHRLHLVSSETMGRTGEGRGKSKPLLALSFGPRTWWHGEFVLDFYLHGKTNGRRNAVNVEQNLVKFSVSMREDYESAIHVSSPDPRIELS
ncbi:hypothetical protein J6590_051417 [Homalodisca vitripennis]|nr:hypothetical protein J6590_051417 [Homalodisca vitripennis]